MMISVMHAPDLSNALPATFPGTSHIYRKEHPAYLTQNGVRLVMWGLFWLDGWREMFLYENDRERKIEKEVMVRSWIDGSEQKEEGVLAKKCVEMASYERAA